MVIFDNLTCVMLWDAALSTPRVREINGWRCPFPTGAACVRQKKAPSSRGGRVICSSHECPAQRIGGTERG